MAMIHRAEKRDVVGKGSLKIAKGGNVSEGVDQIFCFIEGY